MFASVAAVGLHFTFTMAHTLGTLGRVVNAPLPLTTVATEIYQKNLITVHGKLS